MVYLFDIIFQSGEFYGDNGFSWTELIPDISGNLVGGFIGAGSAIWIYYRSVKKDKEEEEGKRFAFEKDKLKYLNLLVINSISFIDNHISGLDKFHEDISKDFINFPLLYMSSPNDLKRIVKIINQEEHNHAYLNQIKSDKIGDIFGLMDYFYDSYKLFLESLRKAQTFDTERKQLFANASIEITELISKALRILKKEGLHDSDIYHNLNFILIDYLKHLDNDKSNLLMIQEILIKPVIHIYLDYRFEKLPFNFDEIGDKSSKVNKMLSPIISNNMTFASGVNELSKELKKHLITLNDYSKPLKEYIK